MTTKLKIGLWTILAALLIGGGTKVSADGVYNTQPEQSQSQLTEHHDFDVSNIVSVFYDGKDTHVNLTNGENWVFENYKGKIGDFALKTEMVKPRARALPQKYYFSSTWYGYGNPPSRVYIKKTLTFYYNGYVQALFKGYIGTTSVITGTGGGKTATYGGYVPRVAASPA